MALSATLPLTINALPHTFLTFVSRTQVQFYWRHYHTSRLPINPSLERKLNPRCIFDPCSCLTNPNIHQFYAPELLVRVLSTHIVYDRPSVATLAQLPIRMGTWWNQAPNLTKGGRESANSKGRCVVDPCTTLVWRRIAKLPL